MKKALILLLLVHPILLLGQMNMGPSIGINFSSIDAIALDFEYLRGISLGMKVNYQVRDNLVFGINPVYSEKGAKVESLVVQGVKYFSEFDFKYIDLPLTISPKYKVGLISLLPILGVSAGYLVSANLSIPRMDNNNSIVYDVYDLLDDDVFDEINPGFITTGTNRISFGPTGGVGALIPFGSTLDLFFDTRFTYDLTDMFITDQPYSKFSNYYFTLSTGVIF